MDSRLILNKGFTLLELLVVLAVMGVMMGLVGFSLAGGGGNELGAAQRELLGIIHKARTQAALSGQEVRLIVNNDPEDKEKYHRFLEIVYQDANESASWNVAGTGKYLTDGVYLVPSSENSSVRAEPWRKDAYSVWSHSNSENFELSEVFKGKRKEGGSISFNYIGFDSSGNLLCQDDGTGILVSPKLVIAVGEPNPVGSDQSIRFNNSNAIAGILLRQFGGSAVLDVRDL